MIESIYLIESIREKHRIAPILAERERYLRYLCEIGVRRERVREVASMLLNVVRLLELNVRRPVGRMKSHAVASVESRPIRTSTSQTR